MIDVTFDFTTDTPHFWERKGADPDALSPMLKKYHQLLWSKELPNGDVMSLEPKKPPYYLTWRDFDFGSDSIIVGMRYPKNQRIIDQVSEIIPDYEAWYEGHQRSSYTIGGMIIFPRHRNSMNQMRGMNVIISDCWALTLECIRRFYAGEDSPLHKVMERDKEFYDLFLDFKGYVDFFLLQDCVSDDYSKVDIWMGDTSFEKSGLPKTVDEYFEFIRKEHEFLEKRNERIREYCDKYRL